MSWGSFFYPHRVRIGVRLPSAGGGPRWEDPGDPVAAEVKDEQRIVRNRDGDEVVSNTQVYVPLATVCPIGSRVTVWEGQQGERTAEVLAVARHDNTGTPLDQYLVLSLE